MSEGQAGRGRQECTAKDTDLQGDDVLMPEGTHDGHFTLEVLYRVAPPPATLCFIRALGSLSFQLNLLYNLQQDSTQRW